MNSDLTERWAPLSPVPGWRIGPYNEQRGEIRPRNTVRDLFMRMFKRIGRPPSHEWEVETADKHLEEVDTRLSKVEHQQRNIASRLQLLEIQSDPRRHRSD